jgi:hypothetical protein
MAVTQYGQSVPDFQFLEQIKHLPSKVCIRCKLGYKPNSKTQLRCTPCRKLHILDIK